MTVRKLSSDVRAKLESGLTITDATQCTLELVENSLDAKATAVAVRVNLREFSIEVVDNGIGISSDDLKLIGRRFMTSKCHNFDDLNNNLLTYGYRGQALASIAEICTKLTIKTKCKVNKHTLIKIFRNGKPSSVLVSSKERSDVGTTVTVYDFMSAMPVRRKRIFEAFDLQDIKNQMEYLAIIHNEVCFTLRDENKGEILLQTHKKNNLGLSFGDLFGLALDKFFVQLNYLEKNVQVQGFVSLKRHSDSNFQFFYVNNRIVFKSMVHKLLNRMIDNYFKENGNLLEESADWDGINLNFPKDNHNVYIVQIYCPYTYFVMFRNLRKTTVEFKNWDVILACIKKAIKSVLCYKSWVPDSDKVDKLCANRETYLPKKDEIEGKLKNGIRGCIVKRKVDNKNGDKGTADKNSKCVNISPEKGFSEFRTLSKAKNITNSDSDASPYSGAPKILSESPIPKENYLKLKTSVLPDLKEPVHAGKVEDGECMNFLIDFVARFQSKLKDDLTATKIYKDFIEYRRSFRRHKFNNRSRDVGTKTLEKKKLMANKTKCSEINRRKDEGNRRKEIDNSDDPSQKSGKIRNNYVKQVANDEMKGIKRNNFAYNNDRQTSKRFKREGKLRNNSLEDSNLFDSRKIPQNVLPDCWFSHQNRINLLPPIADAEDRNFRHLKLNINDKKETEILGRETTNLRSKAQIQDGHNIKNGVEVSYTGKIVQGRKDFGMQTDEDFVITPLADNQNKMHQTPPSIMTIEFPSNSDSLICNDKELNTPVDLELNGEITAKRAKAFSSSVPSLELENLKTVSEQLIPFNFSGKKTVISSMSDDILFDQKSSRKLSDSTKSDKATNLSKITSSSTKVTDIKLRTQTKLAHTDPLNFVNLKDTNGKSVSPDGLSDHCNFAFIERYNFIPKGLSQSVLSKSPVNNGSAEGQNNCLIKKADHSVRPVSAFNRSEADLCGSGRKSLLPDNILGELERKTDENMVYYEKELITANLTKNSAEILSLGSFTITKDNLSNITVVGQWDKKFILGIMDVVSSKEMKFLTIFDQHAVDERIRLEKLLEEFRTSDRRFVSVCCDPPIKCTINETVGRLLPSFESKLADYGVKTSIIDHQSVLLHEIPLCFADENSPQKVETLFQNLLSNIVEDFNKTRGAVLGLPKVLYDVISTKACKNAVKFNDILSNSAMRKMMNDLVACQIPFQCAHGRPCIVPILDVKNYKSQLKQGRSKLNFKKFGSRNVHQPKSDAT